MVPQLTQANGCTEGDVASAEKLRGLAAHLAASIKGQDRGLPRVVSVLQRGELGVTHPGRPKGSFLFVGPTGVGKTETTKAFSRYLFDAEPISFDMSEYQLQSSVEKLIGGSRDDPGLLGRALRGVTKGTVLFDEVEKAHTLVLDLFLQILWEGRITLATGEVVNFCPFYVVFTSNIGSTETMRMENAPFASVERTVRMRVGEALRPELVGRMNEIVAFARLDYAAQRAICEAMIEEEIARLGALGHCLRCEASTVEFLVREGYHRTLGARPMRGCVERFIQDAVTTRLLAGQKAFGRLSADTIGRRLQIC